MGLPTLVSGLRAPPAAPPAAAHLLLLAAAKARPLVEGHRHHLPAQAGQQAVAHHGAGQRPVRRVGCARVERARQGARRGAGVSGARGRRGRGAAPGAQWRGRAATAGRQAGGQAGGRAGGWHAGSKAHKRSAAGHPPPLPAAHPRLALHSWVGWVGVSQGPAAAGRGCSTSVFISRRHTLRRLRAGDRRRQRQPEPPPARERQRRQRSGGSSNSCSGSGSGSGSGCSSLPFRTRRSFQLSKAAPAHPRCRCRRSWRGASTLLRTARPAPPARRPRGSAVVGSGGGSWTGVWVVETRGKLSGPRQHVRHAVLRSWGMGGRAEATGDANREAGLAARRPRGSACG